MRSALLKVRQFTTSYMSTRSVSLVESGMTTPYSNYPTPIVEPIIRPYKYPHKKGGHSSSRLYILLNFIDLLTSVPLNLQPIQRQ